MSARTSVPAGTLLRCMVEGVAEAGCDEAGRGCLCGPVSCAAVILPPDFRMPELNDSKKLTASMRTRLRPVIEEQALAWAVVMVEAEEIDRINILNASIAGMQLALDRLEVRPGHIIVDGNKFKPYLDPVRNIDIPYRTVVKGDGKYMAIAAASVLAKTHRDELMRGLASECHGYGWERNMGYPTRDHYDALRRLGPTRYHRRSFRLDK